VGVKHKERKTFFFEKKKQKTFMWLSRTAYCTRAKASGETRVKLAAARSAPGKKPATRISTPRAAADVLIL
jgi:hypothetical protein